VRYPRHVAFETVAPSLLGYEILRPPRHVPHMPADAHPQRGRRDACRHGNKERGLDVARIPPRSFGGRKRYFHDIGISSIRVVLLLRSPDFKSKALVELDCTDIGCPHVQRTSGDSLILELLEQTLS
jgi:hypothetical protein